MVKLLVNCYHLCVCIQVVVLTDSALAEQKHIADFCHQSDIAVIVTDTRGLFGYAADLLAFISSLWNISICLFDHCCINYMPYGITQCYLPPGRDNIPAFTPAEAGTQLSDPGGMQGWVDLGTAVKVHSPCPSLHITVAFMMSTAVHGEIWTSVLSHCSWTHGSLGHCNTWGNVLAVWSS